MAIVQSDATNVTSTSIPITFLSNVTAGNLIVVLLAASGTISSVADNNTNVYTEVPGVLSSSSALGPAFTDIWYAKNVHAGSTTVTATVGASAVLAMWIYECSGCDLVTPLGKTGVTINGAASIAPTGPSMTTTSANDIAFEVITVLHSVTGIHAGNVFTADTIESGNDAAFFLAASTGTIAAQWDVNTSGEFCASAATFSVPSVVSHPTVIPNMTYHWLGGDEQ